MTMAAESNRDDQVALAHYLSTLRGSGPNLDSRLADAFEKLTSEQLDALIESTLEPGTATDRAAETPPTPEPQDATNEPKKPRRWFRKWTSEDWAWFWFFLADD